MFGQLNIPLQTGHTSGSISTFSCTVFDLSLCSLVLSRTTSLTPLYLETWRLKHETLEEILTIPQSLPHHHATSQRS